MDSSRTKDAAQLRESIAKLEKEIGWDIADKNAENAKNKIQDQIDAYDDYATKGDENLEELLKDVNNFSEEVNSVLKLNQAELLEWLKNNVKAYSESLKDAQQQMVNSWTDTYKQMIGITDTYWDEVAEILSSKESYLEYMKNSDDYVNASDDMKAQLEYQWGDAYDKWILALKDTTNYDHFDNGLGDMSGSEYGSGTGNGNKNGSDKKDTGFTNTIKDAVNEAKKTLYAGMNPMFPNLSVNPWKTANSYPTITDTLTSILGKPTLPKTIKKYASGGIANFTGSAWLDGTASVPERVLNPQQTASFDKLVSIMDEMRLSGVSLEAMRASMLNPKIRVPNLSLAIDGTTLSGSIASIGDVNVTIEEAEINDDRDYDEIAQIVGEKFAKEISKQGVNLVKYGF